MGTLLWTQPSASGLGDRLVDTVQLLAYARTCKLSLSYEWPIFRAKDIDCGHRTTDIQLENVQKYINFPSDVHFSSGREVKRRFPNTLGGYCQPASFYRTYLQGTREEIPMENWIAAIRKSVDDFSFCEDITKFLATVPADFAAVHIRRGDKVRDEQSDGCFIHHSELDDLNTITYKSLDAILARGTKTFFICSDEDHKKQEFVKYVQSKGADTFNLPSGLEKWQTTYYDLATMTKASYVLTSQRYSAFSMFSALKGAGKIDTVYSLASRNYEDHPGRILDI